MAAVVRIGFGAVEGHVALAVHGHRVDGLDRGAAEIVVEALRVAVDEAAVEDVSGDPVGEGQGEQGEKQDDPARVHC